MSTDMPPPTWAAFEDGEIVLQVTGPDAERMVRAVEHDRIAYREPVRPTAANGYALSGPWVDAEDIPR